MGMGIEELLAGRLSGKPLVLVAQALRNPRVASLGADVLRRELGIHKLESLEAEGAPLMLELTPRAARPPRELEGTLPAPTTPAWVGTAELFTAAFRAGKSTPTALLERVLSEIDSLARRQPKLRCFWLRDDDNARRAAAASTQRYAKDAPLGPLDGIPVAIKEHLAVRGLPCRDGHDLPDDELAARDSTVVARLRAAGAIIIGQTTMTELGLSPIGINPKRFPLRNPHHIERTAGGSSTGSAIAASLGLTPFSVGTDGGGSVRTPAAICGVFGLKPTFGRISRGGGKLPGSVTHIGPIGASTLDLAHFLDAASGPDPEDITTFAAPPITRTFASCTQRSVRGLTLGIDPDELRDADPRIVRVVEQSIHSLETCGVQIREIKLPLASHAFAIGSLTILAELCADAALSFQRHAAAYGPDVQTLMQLTRPFSARELMRAQKLRERLRIELQRVFQQVDALASPTTMSTALPVTTAEDRYGRIDAKGVRAMCRHTFLTNLTGHPAASIPVGIDDEGLPIGLQLIGDVWDEGTLLSLMAELERLGVARAARPPYHVELLA